MPSSKPRRIALVVPSLEQGGGVPTVADFYCQTIERSGAFDVKLISLATSARDDLGLSLTKPRTWLRGVVTQEGSWRGRHFTKVGALISEVETRRHYPRPALTALVNDCDLVQVVAGSPASAFSVCGLGKPVSVQCATRIKVERTTRDARPSGALGWWRKYMTSFTDRMDDRALRSVDAIQVSNQWMYEYARALNNGRDVDIRFVPNGVNVQTLRPAEHGRNLQCDPYLLCVGRFSDPRKNLGLLIDAYSRIPEALRARVRLVLAGSTPPLPDFWRRVHECGLTERVTFVDSPTLDELVRLYQRAAAFVLSSAEEGFGMVIVEAMSCGIPVVATACGGPNGIITDGNDGFLVDVDDVNTLSERLTQLLSDPALNLRMGRAGREAVLAKFELRAAGDVLLDVYDRLLSRQSVFSIGVATETSLSCVE